MWTNKSGGCREVAGQIKTNLEPEVTKCAKTVSPTWLGLFSKFVFLHNTYKIQMVPVNLRKRSNHSTFRYLGQFAHSAWTPMIALSS